VTAVLRRVLHRFRGEQVAVLSVDEYQVAPSQS
jgi:hypothetical protein